MRRFWGVNTKNPGWNVLISAVRGGIDKEFVAFRSRLIKIQQNRFLFFALHRFRSEIEEATRELSEGIGYRRGLTVKDFKLGFCGVQPSIHTSMTDSPPSSYLSPTSMILGSLSRAQRAWLEEEPAVDWPRASR